MSTTPRRPFGTMIFGILVVFSVTSSVYGSDHVTPVIVVVSVQKCCPDEAWPEAEQQIATEFRLLGLRVKKVYGRATDDSSRRQELEDVAEQYSAACAVRVLKSSGGSDVDVDLWINDRVTDKTSYRHYTFGESERSDSEAIAALKTVELFRASLLELKIPSKQPGEQPPPAITSLVSDESIQAPPKLGCTIGVSVAGSPEGAGPLFMPELFFGGLPVPWLLLGLEGSISALSKDIVKGGMGATFDIALFRALAELRFREKGLFRPSAGIDAGAAVMWTKGFSDDSHPIYHKRLWTAVLGIRGNLSFAVNANLWFYVGMRVAVMLPRPAVYLAGERAATFGLPLLQGNAGVSFWFG